MSATLRLADLLGGLSVACDLGFGLPPEEAMRSCLIGTALARRLDMPEEEVADTFYTALLMHVGCSALSHETARVFGDERPVLTAVASTNVADPVDISENLMPILLQVESPAYGPRSSTSLPRTRVSSDATSTRAAARSQAQPRVASASAKALRGH